MTKFSLGGRPTVGPQTLDLPPSQVKFIVCVLCKSTAWTAPKNVPMLHSSSGTSSNGRTHDSGSCYRGSNPCVPAFADGGDNSVTLPGSTEDTRGADHENEESPKEEND